MPDYSQIGHEMNRLKTQVVQRAEVNLNLRQQTMVTPGTPTVAGTLNLTGTFLLDISLLDGNDTLG